MKPKFCHGIIALALIFVPLLVPPAGAQTPTLAVTNDPILGVSLYWPVAEAGYSLQWTTSLGPPAAWQPYPATPSLSGDGNNLFVNIALLQTTNPVAFFELVSNAIVPAAPTALTTAATYVTTTTALINGTIQPNGLDTTWWFQWGTDISYGQATTSDVVAGFSTAPVPVDFNLFYLAEGATYHFQLYGSNIDGIASGGDFTFTTVAALPDAIVLTFAASNVTTSSAELLGSVNPNGSDFVGWFQWGTNTSYGNTTLDFPGTSSGNYVVDESVVLTNLAPSTTYHYRIVGYNNGPDEAIGNDVVFNTSADYQPPPAPTVTTLSASSVSAICATLNATVNPNGTPTTAFFEYGTNTSYGMSPGSFPVAADNSVHSVSNMICGLIQNTTYHYRIDAGNSGGSTDDGDVTFTTGTAPPPPPTVQTLAATNLTATGATLEGDANGNNVGSSISVSFEYAHDQYFTSPIYTGTLYGPSGYAQDFGAHLNNLSPSTTYFYRINATNDAGSSMGATVTFTTAAAQPIVLNCPSNIVVTSGSATNVFFSVTASDSLGGTPTVSSVPASGSIFSIGTTTVNSTAYDSHGSNFCSFTVTVVQPDCTVSIYCPSNIVVTSGSATNVFFNVTASDSCGGTPTVSSVPASGSIFSIGTTTVNSTAYDSHGSNFCSFTVTVVQPDCTVSIYCPSNIVVTSGSATNVFFNVTASDSCGGTPTVGSVPASGSIFSIGTTTVNSTAYDSHGSNFCSFTVTVVQPDCTVSIYCPSNIVVTSGSATNVFFNVTASDSCGGTPTVGSVPASGSIFSIGTTTVNSTAYDSHGSNSCSFTVTVHQ